jgi:hypothetical protein
VRQDERGWDTQKKKRRESEICNIVLTIHCMVSKDLEGPAESTYNSSQSLTSSRWIVMILDKKPAQ